MYPSGVASYCCVKRIFDVLFLYVLILLFVASVHLAHSLLRSSHTVLVSFYDTRGKKNVLETKRFCFILPWLLLCWLPLKITFVRFEQKKRVFIDSLKKTKSWILADNNVSFWNDDYLSEPRVLSLELEYFSVECNFSLWCLFWVHCFVTFVV